MSRAGRLRIRRRNGGCESKRDGGREARKDGRESRRGAAAIPKVAVKNPEGKGGRESRRGGRYS